MYIGTIKWHWEDNQGKIHKFLVPKYYYVQEGGVSLLSSQHWAQPQKDLKPELGTMETTSHLQSTLHWKQGKYKRTIILIKHNNVAAFQLAPGFRKFEVYKATAGFQKASNSHPLIVEEVYRIEDDDNSYRKPTHPWKDQTLHAQPQKVNMDLTQEMTNPQ